MQNQLNSSTRRRLTVLAMLISVGVFSTGLAVPATAQASTPTDSVSMTTMTPNGVFGWD